MAIYIAKNYLVPLIIILFCNSLAFNQTFKLWSVTSTREVHDSGTIFNINTNGTGFTKVHDFNIEGGYPFASLTLVGKESLFGMTCGNEGQGGKGGYGTISKINTNGTGFTTVFYFDGTNGCSPFGELIVSGGKLWGMTIEVAYMMVG